MRGARPAAAADDVDDPGLGEFAQDRGHRLGRLVIPAELVGQPGVGMCGHERVREAGELLHVGPELSRPERAVQADYERPGVADRIPERLDGVAGERPAAGVGDRAGDPERHLDAQLIENALDREYGRLGVEDVEDGLDHQQVGAADEQPAGGLGIRLGQLLESDGARGWVGHVRGDRGGLVRWPQRSDNEARSVGIALLGGVGRCPRDPGRLNVDLVGHALHPVIGLGNARGGERVGRDDVGAGRQVRVVDGANDVGARQAEEVVVAAYVARVSAEALAAEVGLGQAVALDERPGRSVEHEDSLLQEWAKQEQTPLTRPGVACRRSWGRCRRCDWGDLCGHYRGNVSLGGPASFCAQCTDRME